MKKYLIVAAALALYLFLNKSKAASPAYTTPDYFGVNDPNAGWDA